MSIFFLRFSSSAFPVTFPRRFRFVMFRSDEVDRLCRDLLGYERILFFIAKLCTLFFHRHGRASANRT